MAVVSVFFFALFKYKRWIWAVQNHSIYCVTLQQFFPHRTQCTAR